MERKPNIDLFMKKNLSKPVSWAVKFFRLFLLVGISYYALYPVVSMFIQSITLPSDMYSGSHIWIPENPTLTNYPRFFASLNYGRHLSITLQIALVSTALQLVVSSLVGYGLARYKFKGNNLVFMLVVFTILMPMETIMLPLNLEFRAFDFFGIGSLVGLFTGTPMTANLLQTKWVYYLPAALGVGLNSGLYIFLFRQFFKGMPQGLEDASRVDGCNSFQTFTRIMVPNTLPVFVTVLLLSVVFYWNETVISGSLLNMPGAEPLMLYMSKSLGTAKMYHDAGLNGAEYLTFTYTGMLVAVAPLTIIYIFLQRFLTECMDHSGIKG